MSNICVLEAKTRQFVVSSVLEVPPSDVQGPNRAWVHFGHEGAPWEILEPHAARQLAHVLLAAADVAEEEEGVRRG